MDAHEYVFVFQNLNILCIFSDRFFDPVFPGSGSVPVFGVDRFNDRSGSGNFGFDKSEPSRNKRHNLITMTSCIIREPKCPLSQLIQLSID
jgi:hypothetical protein